ncbi:MAG: CPBP family intramembrane metalloprotease [Dehalococcoidales bacterium]|nr:CPBP family intramembrane metalloprotease [Dehalococcoidales bacterium]
MGHQLLKKIIAPIIPYVTIGFGLLLLHNAWISIFAYHIGLIIIIMLSRERIPLKQLIQSTNYKIPMITAIVGACGGILLYLLWPLLSIPPDINIYLQSIGLTQKTWPLFIIYFVLVNPWVEEYYWRGYLGSKSKSLTTGDIFFSGYHVMVIAGQVEIIWLFAVFIILFFGAWFWRQSNRISRGLLSSLVSHITADITVICAIFYLTMK